VPSTPHKATERVVGILACLSASTRGLNISELSRRLSIPKSSTHAILLTLESLGVVGKTPAEGRYVLGTKDFRLGKPRRPAP
jgi:IclR family KDG regulon transcriptional repressor